MDTRLQNQAKAPSATSFSPVQTGLFQPRPFTEPEQEVVEASDLSHQSSNLQTQLEPGSRFGHNFSRVQVQTNTPSSIQSQLLNRQPEEQQDEEEANEVAQPLKMMAPPVGEPIEPESPEESIQMMPQWGKLTPVIQRQEQEDEPIQMMPQLGLLAPVIQRQEQEDEPIQMMPQWGMLQRLPQEDDDLPMQMMPQWGVIQRQESEGEEDPIQMKWLQPKLVVGAPGDKYEQEADSVAAQVMSMSVPEANPGLVQRQGEEEQEQEPLVQRSPLADSITPLVQRQTEEQEEPLQAKSLLQRAGNGNAQAGSNVESQLNQSKGGGSPLPDEVRSFMEPRFGTDFSSVRVHTDSTAVQMNKDLRAQAFAHGSDIYYGAGKSPAQDSLTAHELTHVVQQTGALQAKSVSQWVKKENKIQAKVVSEPSEEAQPISQVKENPQKQTGKNNQAQPAKPASAAATADKSGQKEVKPQTPAAKEDTAAKSQKQGSDGKAAKQNVSKPADSDSISDSSAKGGGAKSPASAQNDPAFQAVINKAKGVAQDKKKHDPAQAEAKEAQDAAQPPANEVESKAQDKQVGEMSQQQPGSFNAEAFKAAVMEKVDQAAPKTLEEADKFKDSNLLDSVGGSLSSQAKEAAEQAAGPVEEKTKEAPDTSGIKPKEVKPLEKPEAGAKPPDIGAAKATPKPKPEAEVSAPMKAESQKLDQQMAEANVTEAQLANSGESQFIKAVGAKKEAQAKAVEAPQAYRQQEKATLNQAQSEAQTTSQTQLEGMQGQREQLLAQVTGCQDGTKTKDEQERTKVANDIDGIYQKTKSDVEAILNGLDTEVTNRFKVAADTAKQKFEESVAPQMEEYKQRYDGIWGAGRWVKDKLLGVPADVTAFFTEGRNLYRQEINTALTGIANYVAEQLNKAKEKIAEGRQKIQDYVKGLPEALQQVGTQAAQDIQSQFDELEQSVKDKETQLVDTLAQQYTENLQKLDAQIEEMKASNQPWFAQAFDAMAGAIETINKLKDMLMGVLAKAASAIGSIIKDPIGFLGNLVSGIRQGLDNFVGNIMTHLQTGLMGWLTGAMGDIGLQLPDDIFSLQGIFSLVTQILGLTWDYIRSKAVKMFGEPIVAGMEETVEIFQMLTQGPMALWEHVQEQFGDLKETVIEEIKGMLITQVIMAGVKWIIGLLNPASAFVKAAMAIYDIVMFFVNQGSQVMELVGAITDAVVAIASGAVGGAAKLVENALAKSLPVVIGFLASLLGVGDLAKKVQGIVKKVRDRIDKAIDKVLQKAKSLFKGKKDKGDKDNKDKEGAPEQRTKEEKQEDLRKALGESKIYLDGFNGKEIEEKAIKTKLNNLKNDYKLEQLKPVNKGGYWSVYGKVNPDDEVSTQAKVPVPTGDLSDEEIQVINKLPGGKELLSKLPDVDEAKRKSLIQEARITLDAIKRGEPIEAIGKPIPRQDESKGELTEIDVETENEIIQVKGGNYSNKKKLDDQDLRQMTETKRYRDRRANPKWHYFDLQGNELPVKNKKVVFHFANPPVDPRLIDWLKKKDVEPRVGL